MPKVLKYEPVRVPGGLLHMEIRPPGSWFNNIDYRVFIGGSGRGGYKTLAKAKKALLRMALAELEDRQAEYELKAGWYHDSYVELEAKGLRKAKR